jgi:hypothetical protein
LTSESAMREIRLRLSPVTVGELRQAHAAVLGGGEAAEHLGGAQRQPVARVELGVQRAGEALVRVEEPRSRRRRGGPTSARARPRPGSRRSLDRSGSTRLRSQVTAGADGHQVGPTERSAMGPRCVGAGRSIAVLRVTGG